MILPIRKFVAPELIFGKGALGLLAQYGENFGARHIFIVTDQGVIEAGWADRIRRILDGAGIRYTLFSEVSENPRDKEVMEGARQYLLSGCDVIVALGGGSPIDCAKGIGIVTNNNRNILEFEGVDNVDIPGPPLICIPTTAGSAADVSQFAIINDTALRVKIAIISKSMVPDVALIDPETTSTMDPYLTACTGLDVLTHAVEAYVSQASSPLTDLHALEAIKLIRQYLLPAIENGRDEYAREKVMLASLQAGLAFSNASLGAVHAMAHSLGGFYDFAHGECNALLLEHVIAYNYQAAPDRYNRIARLFKVDEGTDQCGGLVRAVRSFRQQAGIKSNEGQREILAADLPFLAEKALADPCMLTNPRQPNLDDVKKIFTEALLGNG